MEAALGSVGVAEIDELRAEVEKYRQADAIMSEGLRTRDAEIERLRAAMNAVLKAHAEWERACELDSDRADDAWYGLHDAIEHDLKPLL